jgi:omega-amidase
MNIALVSFDPQWKNKMRNLEKCEKVFETFVNSKVDLCIFPETTLTGFCFSDPSQAEIIEESKTLQFFQEKARQFNMAVIFGMFIMDKEEKKIYNAALCVDKCGKMLARYDKLHTFTPGSESSYICQGKNLVNLNLDETTVGLSICYDLRFPGLFRANQMNPKVLVNIANWPSQRDHHWDALLMARAIENQAFAVGVNRSGIDGEGETYSGKSKVYSPQGSQIAEAFHEGLVSTYNIELSAVDSLREKFNTICDDRFHYVLS